MLRNYVLLNDIKSFVFWAVNVLLHHKSDTPDLLNTHLTGENMQSDKNIFAMAAEKSAVYK